MKGTILLAVLLMIGSWAFGQEELTNCFGEMTFVRNAYDFGTVDEGKHVVHTFEFTNTGRDAITIESVKPQCGCVVVTWTKTPVAPGDTGTITVKFMTAGRVKAQHKSLIVTSDCGKKALYIKGFVTPRAR